MWCREGVREMDGVPEVDPALLDTVSFKITSFELFILILIRSTGSVL